MVNLFHFPAANGEKLEDSATTSRTLSIVGCHAGILGGFSSCLVARLHAGATIIHLKAINGRHLLEFEYRPREKRRRQTRRFIDGFVNVKNARPAVKCVEAWGELVLWIVHPKSGRIIINYRPVGRGGGD